MLEDVGNIIFVLGFITIVYLLGKVIDAVTERLIDKTIFSSVYRIILRQFRIFITRFKPIEIRLDYNIRLENSQSKDSIIKNSAKIVKESFTILDHPLYNADNSKFRQKIRLGSLDYTLSVTAIETITEDQIYVENIKILIKSGVEFYRLNDTLINLATTVPSINSGFKKYFGQIHLSDGLFTCETTHGELDALEWLGKEKFNLSLLIKTEERLNIRIYSNKATVSSPDLKITDSTVKYIRELFLNYYL